MLKMLRETIEELIFPSPTNCYFCCRNLVRIDYYGLCLFCIKEVLEKRDLWGYCDICSHFGVRAYQCLNCKSWDSYLDFCQGVGPYGDVYQELVNSFKFKNNMHLAKLMGYLMYLVIINDKRYADADFLLPVPMYWSKQIKRGYNQAEVLAKVISENLKIPCETTTLKKDISTLSQATLNRNDRLLNIYGSMIIRNKGIIKGKHIILVDDIITTGSTLNACAKLLKEGGAGKVSAITWAAGATAGSL